MQHSNPLEKRSRYKKRYQQLYRIKHKRLELTLTPEEDERLKKAAAKHQSKTGTFAKDAIFAYLDTTYIVPNEADVRTLELGLRRIGTNINQLVYKSHREGIHTDRLDKIYDQLKHLETLIEATLRHPKPA